MRALLLALILTVPTTAKAVTLASYVAAADAAYKWERAGTLPPSHGVTLTELRLTSQAFQGTLWRHQLVVARPDKTLDPGHALLIVGAGKTGEPLPEKSRSRLVELAVKSGLVIAEIRQVPVQPLFDGKIEDDLIAHTLMRFFQTNDTGWPALLPMVKSVVRAMDAVQALAKSEWKADLKGFTVTGESKRGWTTWLTAAVDPRVEAIEPLVFDILNMLPQLDHQKDSWGSYSEQMGDYSEQGLPKMLATPAGATLRGIIDPWEMRAHLTQPKVIVLATNDRYWPPDAERFYAAGLPGANYLLHLPNEGHDLADRHLVEQDRVALVLAAAGKLTLPKVTASFDGTRMTIDTDQAPKQARLWRATSPNHDFRDAHWATTGAPAASRHMTVPLAPPAKGYGGAFVELTYDLGGHPFTVTSPLRLYEGAKK